jgi:hypothetical protein
MECQYCFNKFKTLSNLNYHINNARYCIENRNEHKNEKQKDAFKCSKCEKSFTTKQAKQTHEKKCKSTIVEDENKLEIRFLRQLLEDKDKQLNELKKQLQDKDKQLERIAIEAIIKPDTVINNHLTNNQNRINQVVNNLIPITDDHLKEQTQFLTLDHIKNGVNGYVQYALEYPLKNRIACTDYSRRKIKYKDENGEVIDDPEMAKLCQKLFQAINQRNSILIDEYIKELSDKFNITLNNPNQLTEEECDIFIADGDKLIDELFKVKSQKKEITEAANGVKTEIFHDFVKDICSKTV